VTPYRRAGIFNSEAGPERPPLAVVPVGLKEGRRAMAVLLREAIGDRLRRTRTAQHRTLREVSRTARVSLGYLSEVERGRKEPSSELLAAICEALSLPLAELLHGVAGDLRLHLVDDGAPAERALEGGRLVQREDGGSKADLLLARPVAHQFGKPPTARASVVAA